MMKLLIILLNNPGILVETMKHPIFSPFILDLLVKDMYGIRANVTNPSTCKINLESGSLTNPFQGSSQAFSSGWSNIARIR